MNNRLKIWIVAVLVLLTLAAGREVSGLDHDSEVTENAQTLSSDPEWRYLDARTDGQITLLDY